LAFPEETTREACERIAAFCTRNLRPYKEQLAILSSSVKYSQRDEGSEGSTADGTETEEEEEEESPAEEEEREGNKIIHFKLL
jgi:hypothetical protein